MGGVDARTDEQLVAAANRGDATAFEALYLRYRDWVYHLALRFTGEHEVALDVVQDTFVYLLRKFPGFRLTARLSTFLYPAAKHLALVRRRARRTEQITDDELLQAAGAAEATAGSEPGEALRAALALLPPAQREVLLMRYVDDLPLADIAAALAVPLGTVKSRLHNALAALAADPRTRGYFGL